MKKILASLFLLSILFVGCEKDISTEDTSRITYFANFTFEGESVVFLEKGMSYVDSPVTAEEDGQELPVDISVSGRTSGYQGATVNSNVVDEYTISYSAVNSDGFPASVTRTVIVGTNSDLVTDIEGVYSASVQRAPNFTVTAQYSNLDYVFIRKTGDNTYKISDALGGYYDLGRGYGYAYAARGTTITAVDIPGNSFTFTQATIPGFGNVADITNFTVNPATKTISFTGTANFGNGEFHIQLKQVQF